MTSPTTSQVSSRPILRYAIVVLAIEPVAWFFALLASVNAGFRSIQGAEVVAVFLGLALFTVVPPAIALVLAVRARPRATAAVVIASVTIVIGVFFTIPELAPRLMVQVPQAIAEAINQAKGPTSAELETTADELEQEAITEFDDIAVLLDATNRTTDAEGTSRDSTCTVRDGSYGVRMRAAEFAATDLEKEEAFDALLAHWQSLGYEVDTAAWGGRVFSKAAEGRLHFQVDWIDEDQPDSDSDSDSDSDPGHHNLQVSAWAMCVVG